MQEMNVFPSLSSPSLELLPLPAACLCSKSNAQGKQDKSELRQAVRRGKSTENWRKRKNSLQIIIQSRKPFSSLSPHSPSFFRGGKKGDRIDSTAARQIAIPFLLTCVYRNHVFPSGNSLNNPKCIFPFASSPRWQFRHTSSKSTPCTR